MNDFEKMCKQLKSNDCNECNKKCDEKSKKYLCAKNEVDKFVAEDKNKLLSIKSEAQGGSFTDFCSIMISVISFLMSLVSTYISLSTLKSNPGSNLSILCKVIGISAMILALFGFSRILKFNAVYTWRKYILVAIEESEKEMKKKKKDEEKEKSKH